MDVTYEGEDKAATLLCLLPESWDHLVTTIWFSSTDVIDYDTVVGALLFEEMRKISSKETSTTEATVVRGQYTKRGKIRGVHQGLSQKERRVRGNVGSVENVGISRRIVGKDRMHPNRNPQKKQRKVI
jgi:hypothetical protein